MADDNPKPMRCAKCGGRDFYASSPSAFGPKKKTTQMAEPLPVRVAGTQAQTTESTVTLFDKYGGVPNISKIVRSFHKEIMLRPHLAAYFDGIDMVLLAEHTVKYIAFVMGKPAEIYTGRDMYTAHAKYHIHGIHFDEVADVLKYILMQAGVENPDIEIIMRRIESLREMIIV
ncbi:MAG: group I truncated hemoglobin [Limnohabitans sp.]